MRHDNHADAVSGPVAPRSVRCAAQRDLGLVRWSQRGERNGLAGELSAGASTVDRDRVSASVTQWLDGMPYRGIGREDTGHPLADVVDHLYIGQRSGLGAHRYRRDRVDVTGARSGFNFDRGRCDRVGAWLWWRGGPSVAT